MPNPAPGRHFDKWRTPKRRNSALLLLAGPGILILAFAFDTAGVSEPREEPVKGEIK